MVLVNVYGTTAGGLNLSLFVAPAPAAVSGPKLRSVLASIAVVQPLSKCLIHSFDGGEEFTLIPHIHTCPLYGAQDRKRFISLSHKFCRSYNQIDKC